MLAASALCLCTALRRPVLLALVIGFAATGSFPAHAASGAWVASWASAQLVPEGTDALPADDFDDVTLRQIVRLSVGGGRIRIILSNAFGTAPLHIDAVRIALAVSPMGTGIRPTSDHALSFSGSPEVIIPAGAEYLSDPVDMAVPASTDLAISFHIASPITRQTGHPGAHATSYLVRGNKVSAIEFVEPQSFEHWFNLAGVLTEGSVDAATIVAFGDSITDGKGSTTNGNDRWPNALADKLQASPQTRSLAVVNEGIGGNRVLLDGAGENALARFDRDVLALPGVRYVILLEGSNDIGTLTRLAPATAEQHAALVAHILAAYQQMIFRAHQRGIRIIGATIIPFAGSTFYHPDATNEADRVAINQWIRAAGHFDALADFDLAIRDPTHPDQMLPAYDSGDHLHPSPAGYRVMADAVPLSAFK